MKDSELMQLLRRDPYRGMNALTARYAGLLYAVVRAKLPEQLYGLGEVEDIVADTFSDFYLSLDRFHPERCSVKSYLCVMARNKAVDELRRHRSTVRSPDRDVPDSEPDVADVIEEAELRKALLNEIENLGEPDSVIIIKKYYLGRSSKEIAEELDMTVSNVDTRTHRAVARLKKIMGGDKG